MSARISDTHVIFRSRRNPTQFIGKPFHGATGWIWEDGQMIQVNYFDQPDMQKGWFKLGDFQQEVKKLRQLNSKRYGRKRGNKNYGSHPGCCYRMSRHMEYMV